MLLLVSSVAFAQARAAFLLESPRSGRGIDCLGPNAIPCYRGVYTLGGARIDVVFTLSPIAEASTWKPAGCGETRLLSVPAIDSASGPILFYAHGEDWSLFVAFPPGYPDACAFASRIVERFDYFFGLTGGNPLYSFPGVVDLD